MPPCRPTKCSPASRRGAALQAGHKLSTPSSARKNPGTGMLRPGSFRLHWASQETRGERMRQLRRLPQPQQPSGSAALDGRDRLFRPSQRSVSVPRAFVRSEQSVAARVCAVARQPPTLTVVVTNDGAPGARLRSKQGAGFQSRERGSARALRERAVPPQRAPRRKARPRGCWTAGLGSPLRLTATPEHRLARGPDVIRQGERGHPRRRTSPVTPTHGFAMSLRKPPGGFALFRRRIAARHCLLRCSGFLAWYWRKRPPGPGADAKKQGRSQGTPLRMVPGSGRQEEERIVARIPEF